MLQRRTHNAKNTKIVEKLLEGLKTFSSCRSCGPQRKVLAYTAGKAALRQVHSLMEKIGILCVKANRPLIYPNIDNLLEIYVFFLIFVIACGASLAYVNEINKHLNNHKYVSIYIYIHIFFVFGKH